MSVFWLEAEQAKTRPNPRYEPDADEMRLFGRNAPSTRAGNAADLGAEVATGGVQRNDLRRTLVEWRVIALIAAGIFFSWAAVIGTWVIVRSAIDFLKGGALPH